MFDFPCAGDSCGGSLERRNICRRRRRDNSGWAERWEWQHRFDRLTEYLREVQRGGKNDEQQT